MKKSSDKSNPTGRTMRYACGAILAVGMVAALLRLLIPSEPAPHAAPAPVIKEPIAIAQQTTRPVAPEVIPQPQATEPALPTEAPAAASRDISWALPEATAKLLRSLETDGDPSDAVRSITGTGPDRGNARARRAAINQLTVNLENNDIAALIQFLLIPHDDQSGVSATIYNVLRNDVLEVLLRQNEMPQGLGGLMVAMLRNPAEDPVWHDYSMQYMAEYYQRRWEPEQPMQPEAQSHDERTQMLAAYRDAFSQTTDTLAGTALIGFERLSRQYPEIPAQEAAAAALQIATQPAMSSASRLTALRICASTGQHEARTTARELAQIGATTPLRMAAIATLGDIGTPADLPLLNALSGSSNKGIARIATAAHERLAQQDSAPQSILTTDREDARLISVPVRVVASAATRK